MHTPKDHFQKNCTQTGTISNSDADDADTESDTRASDITAVHWKVGAEEENADL